MKSRPAVMWLKILFGYHFVGYFLYHLIYFCRKPFIILNYATDCCLSLSIVQMGSEDLEASQKGWNCVDLNLFASSCKEIRIRNSSLWLNIGGFYLPLCYISSILVSCFPFFAIIYMHTHNKS